MTIGLARMVAWAFVDSGVGYGPRLREARRVLANHRSVGSLELLDLVTARADADAAQCPECLRSPDACRCPRMPSEIAPDGQKRP